MNKLTYIIPPDITITRSATQTLLHFADSVTDAILQRAEELARADRREEVAFDMKAEHPTTPAHANALDMQKPVQIAIQSKHLIAAINQEKK